AVAGGSSPRRVVMLRHMPATLRPAHSARAANWRTAVPTTQSCPKRTTGPARRVASRRWPLLGARADTRRTWLPSDAGSTDSSAHPSMSPCTCAAARTGASTRSRWTGKLTEYGSGGWTVHAHSSSAASARPLKRRSHGHHCGYRSTCARWTHSAAGGTGRSKRRSVGTSIPTMFHRLAGPCPADARDRGTMPPMQTRPEDVGLSSERLRRVDAVTHDYVDRGKLPGVQVLISRRGQLVHHDCYGWTDVEAEVPVRDDTIYRIYSMTKPITSV